jgi:F-type H+-transporting ATPase subunit a
MAQFEIERLTKLELFGYDISFTNSSVFMVAAVVLTTVFMLWAASPRALVPGRAQSLVEVFYEFVANMVRQSIGEEGMKYFPWIFSLFIFIFMLNLLGMLPLMEWSFTSTSHIVVTFALAAMVWIVVTAIGFSRHGLGYLKLFVPEGLPVWLMPLIVPIEVISYLIRPISQSVRLFANMMAGHTMLKVFAGFVVSFIGAGYAWAAPAPILFMVAFTGLEVLVSVLQAFIFTILTCIYLNDAVHMHH